ncbi:MAG: hypothetical protein HKM93_11850 [Desulfobacteraceae bacterium]|nr:hypothetical protein [Desulfobacteraceae bacterium]
MKRVIVLGVFVSLVLLFVYAAITVYDNNLKIGRMWETPGVKPHEQPLLVMDPGVVPSHGGESVYRNTPAAQLSAPMDLNDAAQTALGEKVFFTYCNQCHGNNHDGNGTVGQSFTPLPVDLRSPGVQQLSEGAMFHAVSYGVPGGRQPPLATTVVLHDRWRVVGYIKSLGIRK